MSLLERGSGCHFFKQDDSNLKIFQTTGIIIPLAAEDGRLQGIHTVRIAFGEEVAGEIFAFTNTVKVTINLLIICIIVVIPLFSVEIHEAVIGSLKAEITVVVEDNRVRVNVCRVERGSHQSVWS